MICYSLFVHYCYIIDTCNMLCGFVVCLFGFFFSLGIIFWGISCVSVPLLFCELSCYIFAIWCIFVFFGYIVIISYFDWIITFCTGALYKINLIVSKVNEKMWLFVTFDKRKLYKVYILHITHAFFWSCAWIIYCGM